jgi:diaminopropionate ammonia-lyase
LRQTTNRYFIQPEHRTRETAQGLFSAAEYEAVREFYLRQRFPVTPIVRLPGLARTLHVGEILMKDESGRSTLQAFKLLGVEYAVQRLAEAGRLADCSRLVCATDGNHGRAVAHAARKRGYLATVLLPGYTVRARIEAIRKEGAEVVVVDEGYDAAVLEAARVAEREGATVVSDTSWPGYEEIPRWIMAGYTQIMAEAANQWLPDAPPDVVFVQVGVGGLAGAVVSWLCHQYGRKRPFVIGCEPAGAACLLESLRAGKPVRLEGSLPTIMAGLRCGRVSMIAWPPCCPHGSNSHVLHNTTGRTTE